MPTRPDNREFHVLAPSRLWVSEFTYVVTWVGFIYVAFVTDVYARYIVGQLHDGFVLDALDQTIYER